MPSIPTVISVSFGLWILAYISWLVFSPKYRQQEVSGWRRMVEPHLQNYVTYTMFVVVGVIFGLEAVGSEFSPPSLVPLLIGIGGVVGLAVITLKRLHS